MCAIRVPDFDSHTKINFTPQPHNLAVRIYAAEKTICLTFTATLKAFTCSTQLKVVKYTIQCVWIYFCICVYANYTSRVSSPHQCAESKETYLHLRFIIRMDIVDMCTCPSWVYYITSYSTDVSCGYVSLNIYIGVCCTKYIGTYTRVVRQVLSLQ